MAELLRSAPGAATTLRSRLEAGEMVLAPGCYDALGARLVEEGGKTPAVTHGFLRELGFKLVIFPLTILLAATAAIRSALARIKADGTPIELLPSLLPFDDFLDFIGMTEIRELERRFAEG